MSFLSKTVAVLLVNSDIILNVYYLLQLAENRLHAYVGVVHG